MIVHNDFRQAYGIFPLFDEFIVNELHENDMKNSVNGTNGVGGKKEMNGVNGTNGVHGETGEEGSREVNGANGVNGVNGHCDSHKPKNEISKAPHMNNGDSLHQSQLPNGHNNSASKTANNNPISASNS